MVVGAVVVIAIAFLAGLLPRSRQRSEIVAEAKAEAQELPVVMAVPCARSAAVSELSLSANIQAVTEAPILARADGYLKQRSADIGDKVKAGQILAEIEAPELDQQVNQGRATVEQLAGSSGTGQSRFGAGSGEPRTCQGNGRALE